MEQYPWLLVIVVPLIFVGSMGLAAVLGGWVRLARTLAASYRPEGRLYRNQTLTLGLGTNYSGCIHVTLCPEGLHLEPMLLFRAFHAPLLLPWSYLKQVGEERLLLKRKRLEFEVEGVKVKVYLPLETEPEIRKYAPRAFPALHPRPTGAPTLDQPSRK